MRSGWTPRRAQTDPRRRARRPHRGDRDEPRSRGRACPVSGCLSREQDSGLAQIKHSHTMTAETSNSRLSFPQIGNAPERTIRRSCCSRGSCKRLQWPARRFAADPVLDAGVFSPDETLSASGQEQQERQNSYGGRRTMRRRKSSIRVVSYTASSRQRRQDSCWLQGFLRAWGVVLHAGSQVGGGVRAGCAALEVMRARRGWRLRTSGCWPQIRRSRSAEREDQLHLWSSGHDQGACGAR